MIKIEHLNVYNLVNAIYAARNPMNSWSRSDSTEEYKDGHFIYHLGNNDFDLALRLVKAGTEHRKFLRQIFVSFDLTAPLYIWKQLDTYKVGTTSNSTSTMHKIHAKEFTLEDFSFDTTSKVVPQYVNEVIKFLNETRESYLETKNKDYWQVMIEALPSSYNQKRTITCNYENLINMICQRRHHKLLSWHDFCDYMLEHAPYLKEFIDAIDNK